MNFQLKLEARAILLEQFNDGISDVNKALERVAEEIGPKSISKIEADLWYRRFKMNNTEMIHDVSKSQQKLMANGTLAKSMRALSYQVLFYNCYSAGIQCIDGTDHRFQVAYEGHDIKKRYWLVDTFNNVKKEISFDTSDIEGPRENELCAWNFGFDSNVGFYGTVDWRRSSTPFLYRGDFDFVNCCLKINTLTEVPGSYYSTEILGTQLPFRVMTTNKTKFVETSLADGSKTEHKIEEKNRLTEGFNAYTPYIWIGDKCLLGLYNRADDVSTVAQFDASKKEWKKTEMETEGQIQGMSTTNGLLIVYSKKPKSLSIQTYRFNYTQTDSLANLTWRAMRRYSRFNPQFQKWFVSKMPKESRFRPLW
ncbi:hypothetical protein M3Y95_00944100 [Aphelenchoides besseyi]|nr:hypothetical protein M3Y95_00944100 [Aphelenchoides besseyi]